MVQLEELGVWNRRKGGRSVPHRESILTFTFIRGRIDSPESVLLTLVVLRGPWLAEVPVSNVLYSRLPETSCTIIPRHSIVDTRLSVGPFITK